MIYNRSQKKSKRTSSAIRICSTRFFRVFIGICIFAYVEGVDGAKALYPSLLELESKQIHHDLTSYAQESKEYLIRKNDYQVSLKSKRYLNISVIQGGSQAPCKTGKTNLIHKSIRTLKVLTGTGLILGIAYVINEHKGTLFDGDKFQQILLSKLSEIKELGVPGLFYYSLGLSIWEMLGLPTVPIETVAGMTFDFDQAVLASAIGKSFGAVMAFSVGRFFLSHIVWKRLSGNDILQLIDRSIAHTPYRSSLCMKFSCFPEIMKNLALSVMPPVSIVTFSLATCTHGIPFTILWSCLGRDAAMRLRASEPIPPNYLLNGFLVATTIFGFVGSPALLALWIKNMQQYHYKK